MSEIIDLITAHYDSFAKRAIVVPEWQATFYVTPVTISERNRIYRGSTGDNDYGTLVRILIVKAMDADGKPYFSKADEPKLLNHADSAVITRVAAEIMASDSPKEEALKKD